jgi:hypothetical protein
VSNAWAAAALQTANLLGESKRCPTTRAQAARARKCAH